MNIHRTYLCLGLCSLLVPASGAKAATQASFYVSPSGSDSNPGTEKAPYRTITRARDGLRRMNGSMRGDLVVHLRGGTYLLTSPIQFNEKDGGTNIHDVISVKA